jgi:mannitol/fructose-specific phosphotransferase system IIA component (Ntr-type)
MRFTDLLQPTDIVVPLEAADKWEAIEVLMDHLRAAGRVEAQVAPELLEQVLVRERSMSTGMEKGIAIPHAAVDQLEGVVACLGLVKRAGGLAFDCMDSRPSNIVVLLLIPRAQKLQHIRTLADIARLLARAEVREGLLAAPDAEGVYELLRMAELESA